MEDPVDSFIQLDSSRIFQDFARNLAREGKFREALSVYSFSCAQSGSNKEFISDVGGLMIDHYNRLVRQQRGRSLATDPWSCCFCAGVLVDPVTLSCGHTACRRCILKDLLETCKKCGNKYKGPDQAPVNETESIKVSILVSELVKKFWSNELQAIELRNEGNRMFQRGETKISVEKYSEAFDLAPLDHLLTSNRSHGYHKLGDYQAALEDAERTIRIRPDWGKGYFRKGMAHQGLGNHGEALVAFFECLVLEETVSKHLKMEIIKVLFLLVTEEIKNGSGAAPPLSASPAKTSSATNTSTAPTLTTSAASTAATSASVITTASTTSAGPSAGSAAESAAAEPSRPSDSASNHPSEASSSRHLFKEMTLQQAGGAEGDSDGAESDAGSGGSLSWRRTNNKILIPRNHSVCRLLERIEERVGTISSLKFKPENRSIDPAAVDINDFECSLCFRLLWQPVTTSCGHTYCRCCLDRSLDHRRECPLCKSELENLTGKLFINEFVDQTIRRVLPAEWLERQRQFEEEMAELSSTRGDGRVEVPVFVCTMSFPAIPCPLHVFEPRYRLMIRRAMESGTREFGMSINDPQKIFADYGTMLEIRDIQYFADGRSVVDTMGSRRFHVLERGTKDGYNTAVVEFMSDEVPVGEELEELKALHDRTRSMAVNWFEEMEGSVKVNITSHYGAMPIVETDYWTTASGPAWAWWVLAILPLDTLAQQQILSQIQLKRRLEAIGRILGWMKRRGGVPS